MNPHIQAIQEAIRTHEKRLSLAQQSRRALDQTIVEATTTGLLTPTKVAEQTSLTRPQVYKAIYRVRA